MSVRAPCVIAMRSKTVHSLEPPIEHRDVTTIMGLLGDIQADVRMIREVLEDDDGEAQAPEDDR
jgi:hypothetical protein